MQEDNKEFKRIKILSLIFIIAFAISGLASIFSTGSVVSGFFNKVGYFFGLKEEFDASPLTLFCLKLMGGLMLMWAYLLVFLMKEPLKNAVVASASGVGFLILAIVHLYMFFSKDIMAAFPPYIIAARVLFCGIVGLLFLIWTPREA
jgi:hypothetical protein